MPRRAEAAAGRLLRVLFLRLGALSAAPNIRRRVLLRSMKACCSDETGDWRPLNRRQRWARFIVGAGMLVLSLLLPWSHMPSIMGIATAAIIGWFGVTHILAGLLAYPGCPELGAIPSLLMRRVVRIGCGPWRWLDARLRLRAE